MSSPYFQKSRYILIDTVDDLDPRRISIRDLNKKYMDREGNRYALRFDLNSRQIHVVRLAGSKDEAVRIRAEILRQRRAEKGDELEFTLEPDEHDDPFKSELPEPLLSRAPDSYTASQPSSSAPEKLMDQPHDRGARRDSSGEFRPSRQDASGDLPDPSQLFSEEDSGFIDDFTAPGTPVISEIDLFPELEREISRIIDSQKAIIKVMSRSRVLDHIGGSEDFFATAKKVDESCIQAAVEAARLYQELSGFPKSPLHYLSSFPAIEKKRIEALPDERQQIEQIKHYELHRTYSELLRNILDLTIQLRRSLEGLPESERSKQYFIDLIPSFAEITGKASSLQHRLQEWFRQTV